MRLIFFDFFSYTDNPVCTVKRYEMFTGQFETSHTLLRSHIKVVMETKTVKQLLSGFHYLFYDDGVVWVFNTHGGPRSVGAHTEQTAAARQSVLHGEQVHLLQPLVHGGAAYAQAFQPSFVLRLGGLGAANVSSKLIHPHFQLGAVRIVGIHLVKDKGVTER